MEIKDQIVQWAQSGGDFISGINLFLQFNRNGFYARNIQAKGEQRGMQTLLSEFSSKSKVPVKDLLSMIALFAPQPTKEDPDVTHLQHQQQIIQYQAEQEIAVTQRKVTRLREEFPFLSRRDCPDELVLLVNTMLNAFDEYREKRKELFQTDARDTEKCYAVARAVLDPYLENREIWEEMNHYKVHGTILGKHPEFRQRAMKDKYREMGTVDLVKISNNNIPRKMSYYKKMLSDPETKNMDDIRAKAAEAEGEISIIRGILRERGEL